MTLVENEVTWLHCHVPSDSIMSYYLQRPFMKTEGNVSSILFALSKYLKFPCECAQPTNETRTYHGSSTSWSTLMIADETKGSLSTWGANMAPS